MAVKPTYPLYYSNSIPIPLEGKIETIVSKILINKKTLPRLVDSMEDKQ